MLLIMFVISFAASIIGAICGIGGGVIIKPVLDATGLVSVSSASLLSGCTVLAMSIVSLLKRTRLGARDLDINRTLPLALGAVFGGVAGRSLFKEIVYLFGEKSAGITQQSLLLILTIFTLFYAMREDRIKTQNIRNPFICVLVGLFLGSISSLLGIGGGPINLVVLSFFFSMKTKTAGLNSIFIIFMSQLASFINTAVSGGLEQVNLTFLGLMVAGGIIGGFVGSAWNKKLSSNQVRKMLIWLMVILIFICIYNLIRYKL